MFAPIWGKSLSKGNSLKNFGQSNNHQAGFTLVELVMVLVIAGIMISFFATSLFNMKKETELTLTQKRIEAISDSVRRYTIYNERLPCPASLHLDQQDANYGWFDNTSSNCAGAGITVSSGVVIGMVPVRSLNLPSTFATDAWGSRLMFAVSQNLANRTNYNAGQAPVVRVDSNPVPFVVFSVGPDRKGGYPQRANTGAPIACGNASGGLDFQNCNGDRDFTFQAQSTLPGANYYDDIISFRYIPRVKKSDFISGAVVAFRSACPPGWTAFTDASGRSIIGMTQGGPISSAGTSPAKYGYSGDTFSYGQQGGSSVRVDQTSGGTFFHMPPYRAHFYCRKD